MTHWPGSIRALVDADDPRPWKGAQRSSTSIDVQDADVLDDLEHLTPLARSRSAAIAEARRRQRAERGEIVLLNRTDEESAKVNEKENAAGLIVRRLSSGAIPVIRGRHSERVKTTLGLNRSRGSKDERGERAIG